MSTLEAEVVEAFQSIGIAPDLAMKAAVALHHHDNAVDERLAKRDAQIGELGRDIKDVGRDVKDVARDVAAGKIELAAVKADVTLLKWMMGFLLTINLAILLKLLLH